MTMAGRNSAESIIVSSYRLPINPAASSLMLRHKFPQRLSKHSRYPLLAPPFILSSTARAIGVSLAPSNYSKRSASKADRPREVADVWQNHAPDRAASHVYDQLSDEESKRFMRIAPCGEENWGLLMGPLSAEVY